MPPSVYVRSDWADGLTLASRLQADGVRASARIAHPSHADCGRGYIPLVECGPPKDALVFFDTTGHGHTGQMYRRQGHPVIGGNPLERELEIDRAAGARLMRECGMAVPETHGFQAIPDALRFLGRHEGAWFVKFSGEHGPDLTAGKKTAEAMIRHLRWVAASHAELTEGFELQRKVDGIEVSVEGWFDGTKWVPPFNITLEDKRFLAGNRGANTGCEANLVVFLKGSAPKLAKVALLPLTECLTKAHYVGPIDRNNIVSEDGTAWGLEWTARPGWDAFTAYMHHFDATLYDQLRAFAEGELDRWEPIDATQLSLTLRVSVSPYPIETGAERALKMKRGAPLDPELLEDLGGCTTINDVMKGPDKGPVLAGSSGFIGTLGAVGHNLSALRRSVLERARALDIDGLQFRPDPVKRAEHDLQQLVDAGVLESLPELKEAA